MDTDAFVVPPLGFVVPPLGGKIGRTRPPSPFPVRSPKPLPAVIRVYLCSSVVSSLLSAPRAFDASPTGSVPLYSRIALYCEWNGALDRWATMPPDKPATSAAMPPSVRRFIATVCWVVITAAAAAAGGTATIVACTWSLEMARHGYFAALLLLPSIVLYFVLDGWRPDSRAKLFGFAAPVILAACFLAAVANVFPHPVDIALYWRHAAALAGAMCAICLSIRWKQRWRTPETPKFQFGLSSLFVVTTLCAVLFASLKTLGPLYGSIAFGWGIAIVLIMIAVQGTGKTPRGGWLSAGFLALAAVYGPFVAATAKTWLFLPDRNCNRDWLELVWIAPGGMIEMLAPLLLGRNPSIPPVLGIVIAGLLSVALVGITAWLTRRTPMIRWVTLAIVASFAAIGTFIADALLRA